MRAISSFIALGLSALLLGDAAAQTAPAPGEGLKLSLEDAKSRALHGSPAVALAQLQIEEKTAHEHGVIAQFFPSVKLVATYLHFSRSLGTTLTGSRFAPVQIAVFDQDQVLVAATATQPITPLFALWMLLDISRADERIAAAKNDEAIAETGFQVEKVFLSLLVAKRQRAFLDRSPRARSTSTSEEERRARLDALKKGLALDTQIEELTGQLNRLIGAPVSTALDLISPEAPLPVTPTFEQVMERVRRDDPEIRIASATTSKAEAATRLQKMMFGPEVEAVGGWAYQHVLPLVPDNFGFVGVDAAWNLDFAKSCYDLRERQAQLSQARLGSEVAAATLEGDVRKALRGIETKARVLQLAAEEVASLREMPRDRVPDATLAEAELETYRAEMDLRLAHAELAHLYGAMGAH